MTSVVAAHRLVAWLSTPLVAGAESSLSQAEESMTRTPRPCLTVILAMFGLAGLARGTTAQEKDTAAHALGTVDFPVSCSESAQAEFNRAIALLHHMTYPQARQAFERVVSIDPNCAMAHWGVAMTLFQPLWPTRPSPGDLRRGWEEVQRATVLAPSTDRERLFVTAAEAFFRDPESTDYWQRLRRWEQAMEGVHTAYPDDPEAAAFYALSHLAVAPADSTSRRHSERAAGIILSVYERNPDHPGAMHYLVHANDAPGRERDSLAIVRKYETSAPRNPHALHMPTHIYTRLGQWDAVIRGNLRAAEAALEHPAGDRGQFVWDEFPHAIEYVVYAYLQQGQDEEAAAQLTRMRETANLEPTFKTAFHLASTSARYALERRAWREAVALTPRDPPSLAWDRFAWPEAVTWFARGLGAVHEGNAEQARAAVDRLDTLESSARGGGEVLFAQNIRILRLTVGAWLAHLEGREDSSVALMRQAAELEVATPKHAVTPGPTLPAHELLGDLLLAQERPAEALVAYRRSLESYPKRFNSLLGAARAARASGDDTAARTFYRELIAVAGNGSRAEPIREARTFVAAGR
jgi:tetratricopeptide (TPR) repeat protein